MFTIPTQTTASQTDQTFSFDARDMIGGKSQPGIARIVYLFI